MTTRAHNWQRPWPAVVLTALLAAGAGCGTGTDATEPQAGGSVPAPLNAQTEPPDPSLLERVKRERWAGDLDGMVERRYIRALVTYNRSYYFYDEGEARGISYEGLKEFEKFL